MTVKDTSTRRDFIKKVGAAAVSAAAVAPAAIDARQAPLPAKSRVIGANDRINVGVSRLGYCLQEGRRLHDLAALAIAALRDVVRFPGCLERMLASGCGQPFDRGNRLALERANRRDAAARRLPADVHRARAAQPGAAAELGAGELQRVAQDPE